MSEPEKIADQVESAMAGVRSAQWRKLREPFEQTEKLTKRWTDEKTGQEKSFTVDYIGHAVVTDRLLQVDPTYTFEPLFDNDGRPLVTDNKAALQPGDQIGVWARLTILGYPIIEFCGGKDLLDAYGRCLCRAAMRRGVALDLWIKTDEFKLTNEMAGAGKPADRRQEGATPDPPPTSWQGKNGIRERLEKGSDTPDVWGLFQAFCRAYSVHEWGMEKPDTQERRNVLFQRAATVTVWLMEEVEPVGPGLYDFGKETMQRGWAKVVDGHILEIPDYVAPESEPEPEDPDEVARREAEAASELGYGG